MESAVREEPAIGGDKAAATGGAKRSDGEHSEESGRKSGRGRGGFKGAYF